MGIRQRQLQFIMNKAAELIFKDGRYPTFTELLEKVRDAFFRRGRVPGYPFFGGQRQVKGRKIFLDRHLENMADLKIDLNLGYEESVEQAKLILKGHDWSETERRKLRKLLSSLERDVDDLLLIADNTDNYFFCVGDDFFDTSKINLDDSTIEIDTAYGTISIPSRAQGTEKLRLLHLYSRVMPPDWNVQPPESVASSVNPTGTNFGNCIQDLETGWKTQVTTTQKIQGLTASFSLPLTPRKDLAELINHIEVENFSPSQEQINIQYSVDGGNTFQDIPVSVHSQILHESAVWEFSDIAATHLKFIITKYAEDFQTVEKDTVNYIYEFGLKNLNIYRRSVGSEATLYSIPLQVTDHQGNPQAVDKCGLEACEVLPEGGEIEFSIAPCDANGNSPGGTQLSWHDILPNYSMRRDIAKTVHFDLLEAGGIEIVATQANPAGGLALYDTIQGVPLYYVREDTDFSSYEVLIPDSLRVWRGYNQWHIEKLSAAGSTIYRLTCYVRVDAEGGTEVTIKANPGSAGTSAFDGVIIDNKPVGAGTEKASLSRGWHKLQCSGNTTRNAAFGYQGDFTNLIGAAGDNKVDFMCAFANPMQRIALDDLIYNTPYGNHERYAIIEGVYGADIIINWETGAEYAAVATDGDALQDYDNGPGGVSERFLIGYKFSVDPTNYLRFKAVLKSGGDGAGSPLLTSYKLKLGY